MIIELFGLPAAGKSSLARKLQESKGYKIVKIKNNKELFYYNLFFFFKHPIKFFVTIFYIILNSSSFKMFYYKMMNLFLHHNAKYQKALKYKNAILDQGYFQNMLSLFENKIDKKNILTYSKFLLKPDLLIVLDTKENIREERLAKRQNNPRVEFGEDYQQKWFKIVKENYEVFKDNLDNLKIGYLFKKNSSQEFIGEYFKNGLSISYIINARIPTEKAHGFQITRMCSEFAKAGNAVELIFPQRENQIKEDLFSFYKLEKNFRFREIKSFDFLKYAKYLRKFAYWFQIWFFLFKLLFIRIDKNNLVYTRNTEIAWLFSRKGFVVVYECHDWFSKNKKISLYFLKKVKFIISTNNYINNEFVKNGFSKEKLLVAPNGIDLDVFDIDLNKEEALSKLDIEDGFKNKIKNKKVLLYTGSFETMGQDKGIGDILKSIKLIKDDVLFLAVGGSEKSIKKYQYEARNLGVQDKVFFLPRVDQSLLALFQKIADILLMPFPDRNHYRYFMTPLKMFEYMASGKTIIASDLPSIKEILNEKNAIFCKPNNPQDLSAKVSEVLKNSDNFENISKQARIDILKYSWQKRAEKILKFIK